MRPENNRARGTNDLGDLSTPARYPSVESASPFRRDLSSQDESAIVSCISLLTPEARENLLFALIDQQCADPSIQNFYQCFCGLQPMLKAEVLMTLSRSIYLEDGHTGLLQRVDSASCEMRDGRIAVVRDQFQCGDTRCKIDFQIVEEDETPLRAVIDPDSHDAYESYLCSLLSKLMDGSVGIKGLYILLMHHLHGSEYSGLIWGLDRHIRGYEVMKVRPSNLNLHEPKGMLI